MVVTIIGERSCTSVISFGVDGEKKFLQHFIVGKNEAPLQERVKWEIFSYSEKYQQNEVVG